MSNPKNFCQLLLLLVMVFNSCVKVEEADHTSNLPQRTAIHQISIGEVLTYLAHHKKEEIVSFGSGVSVNILDYLDWSNYSVCSGKNGNQILLVPLENNNDLM